MQNFYPYIKLYLGVLAVFLAVDALWLGLVARIFYQQQLGHLLKASPNWLAALAFYLLFVVGLLVFVVVPAVAAGQLKQAILLGFFFGVVSYATYDLTNLATLEGWPALVVVIDILWGGVLAMTCSVAGFYLWGLVGG